MLRTQKRVLASEHPGTLTIASILAGSLSYQGRYNAEPMQRELLGGQKRVLGAEHPDTLTSANHLATFLSHQGKHADAERMQGEVLGAHMRVLEPQHPNSLMSAGNLAESLLDQGQNAEAELLPAALASCIMPALSHRTADRKNPRGRAGAQAAGQQAACAATAAARPLPAGTRVLVQPLFAKPEHNGKRARAVVRRALRPVCRCAGRREGAVAEGRVRGKDGVHGGGMLITGGEQRVLAMPCGVVLLG